jgi:hypothetical protein
MTTPDKDNKAGPTLRADDGRGFIPAGPTLRTTDGREVTGVAVRAGDGRRDKGTREAEVLGVDYQRAGQVRQLLAERANMVAYNAADRVASIDLALQELGYTGDLTAGADGDPGRLPEGRASRADKSLHTDAPTAPEPRANVGKAAAPAAPSDRPGPASKKA